MLSLLLVSTMGASVASGLLNSKALGLSNNTSNVSAFKGKIKTNISQFFDSNVVQKLPGGVSGNDYLSVIVCLTTQTLVGGHDKTNGELSIVEYAQTKAGQKILNDIYDQSEDVKARLADSALKSMIYAPTSPKERAPKTMPLKKPTRASLKIR